MKIQYCSDLHLEFNYNEAYLNKNPIVPTAEVLIIAGDLMPFRVIERHTTFFNYLSDNFRMVYWIPGNHEYYHSDLSGRFSPLNEAIRSNVLLVNNHTVIEGETTLILSTLWSSIGSFYEREIKARMNDFKVIRYEDRLLLPSDVNGLHNTSKDFIVRSLSEKTTEKVVVVTHHVPTFLNYPERYKGDALNQAFASELFELIEPSGINYWIFGHHHQNMQSFKIGKTELITNQLGYVHHNEHLLFKCDRVIAL